MWTYKKPYISPEFTRDYIEDRGRLALSRALNIGRVVGFVGSGATAAYGRPSWTKLVEDSVKNAQKVYAKTPNVSRRGAAQSLNKTLDRLRKTNGINNYPTHTLGLAENLARVLDCDDVFRNEVAKLFSYSREYGTTKRNREIEAASTAIRKILKKRLPKLFEYRAEPLACLINHLGVTRLLTLNYDTEIEKEFINLFRTSGSSRLGKKSYKIDRNTAISSPKLLNINNLEEPLNVKILSDFEMLCSGDYESVQNLPERVEYSDGTTRSVLSLSLNSTNVGDLVNFALQPRQFVAQVAHLHGRYDKPEDIVLTDADYRRTYLKSDIQQKTFEEALSALMTGNDILFVGVGMSEDDLLRPLRQFVSQDRAPDIAQRHVFTMLTQSVSIDDDFFTKQEALSSENLERVFLETHLNWTKSATGNPIGTILIDSMADEAQALELRAEYGVYTLFYGGDALRTLRIICQLLKRGIIRNDRPTFDVRNDHGALLAALTAAADKIRALANSSNTECGEGFTIPHTLFFRDELLSIEQFTRSTVFHLKSKVGEEGLPAELKQYATHLETEARSRALHLELEQLAKERLAWWKEWRESPQERDSEFARRYHSADLERKRPCVARHRPVYKPVPRNLGHSFNAIEALKEQAHMVQCETAKATKGCEAAGTIRGGHLGDSDTNTLAYFELPNSKSGRRPDQRNFIAVPPKRILRASMPRGCGKGSLLHILQQELPGTPSTPRFFLDEIFGGNDESFRYHGSFVLHLSFSMEFSSVISAMKEFIEQAVVGIFTEYPKKIVKNLKSGRLEHGAHGTFLEHLRRNSKAILVMLENHCRVISATGLDAAAIVETKTRHGENVSREFLQPFWQDKELAREAGKVHRLEELRSRISAFSDIVDLLGDENIRLFIAISGVDKLCDNLGLAYNPMFRAFFRMLTGCAAKYPSESDATTPLDLLFVSGSPDVPTRYISIEHVEEALKTEIERPKAPDGTDHYSSYQKFRRSVENRFLEIWPRLPHISPKERYWLVDRELTNSHTEKFIQAICSDGWNSDYPEHREIRRLCHKGVAFSSWCAGAYATSQNEEKHGGSKTSLDYFLNRLNAAATKGGVTVVLDEILAIHKKSLRQWAGKIEKEFQTDDFWTLNWWREIGANSTPTEPEQHRWKYTTAFQPNDLVDLTYLVLSYLALFPMPVELRVLYGCNEIHDLLQRICDPVPATNSRRKWKVTRSCKRFRRLRLLSMLLNHLHDAHLVIAVKPKPVASDMIDTSNEKMLGGEVQSADDVHMRFTIQHQLRTHASRLMDLSVPDQGERNFFQVSVYCDQPRDLPTPRPDHYRLVRSVMERQIEQVRNTIWCLLQLSREFDDNQKIKLADLEPEEMKLALDGLKRRFVDQANRSETQFDPHLQSFHAVPQRIRALYGMLRSGFSVGTISRLPGFNEEDVPDQPYERFRGWLRGVTNAAIGWDKAVDRIFEQTPEDDAWKTIQKTLDVRAEKPDFVRRFSKPLYRDEIGWMLNERGLISLVQGHIFDSLPLFQRAIDEMQHNENREPDDPALHAAVRRVRLNRAVALIERGQLTRARSELNDLILPKDFSSHFGSQVSWISRGYLGLIDHLSGNQEAVEKSYREVVEIGNEKRMLRLVAIFSRHWADLLREVGDYDRAKRRIEISIAAATESEQRDILNLAKLSSAHIALREGKAAENAAGEVVNKAIHFAQSMGIPRLECHALRLHAEIMLQQGERILAGTLATRAAAIAGRNGMRLQKLHALKFYGSALVGRGHFDLARQVLRETRREAERRGYQSLARGLSDEISRLP